MNDDVAVAAGLPWPERAGSVVNPLRLTVFRTVVERRSFTRAAEALSLTQPAVSAHVRALEQALGTRLFERRRRGAQLTEAGQAVYGFAVAVEREITVLQAQLSDLAGGAAGTVALGAAMIPGTYIVPALLARFHREYPRAVLQLHVLPPGDISEQVLHGRLDFGGVSVAPPLAPALRAEPLWAEPNVLVAAPTHRLASSSRVSLADLSDEPFVGAPTATGGGRALEGMLARAGLPARRIVLALGHAEGIKQAVLEGVGLAVLLERIVASELSQGQLVALPLDPPLAPEQYQLIYRRQHRFSPLAQNLMAHLRETARAAHRQAPHELASS